MLNQKALEDFSDIDQYLKIPNHLQSRNIRITFSMANSTATCMTVHVLMLVFLRAKNRIHLKIYEISNFLRADRTV